MGRVGVTQLVGDLAQCPYRAQFQNNWDYLTRNGIMKNLKVGGTMKKEQTVKTKRVQATVEQ